ncbi:hypothetical protein MGMO_138c00140 [Methyloglobulus morosus KoM1]|uniref:Uncharacterized protein n=1 Tax=Methyloglobulus morosus KoM1 TaxID=1116472 RepID=V5DP23_9GAMM|nr:hypothetical protein [Methyloglobulus morosus]ESS69176.1 hypothetical protein MGMO_138c00140 [Methyloglobulus morosus KoM1]
MIGMVNKLLADFVISRSKPHLLLALLHNGKPCGCNIGLARLYVA